MDYSQLNNNYSKWFRSDQNDVAGSLYSTIIRIQNQNSSRRRDDELFMRMFGSYDIIGKGEKLPRYSDERSLRFNLLRSAALTAQAHIGALNPKAKFQTNDADWTLTRKARANEMAVSSIFDRNDFGEIKRAVFLDASVSSLGGVKVFSKNGEVKIERTFPGEILVDIREGYYGNPRNLYQVKLVDKDALSERFPKQFAAINQSVTGDVGLFPWLEYDSMENQVLLIEGWHIGAYNNKTKTFKGGKHVIAVRNAVLWDEDWNRETFPFAFYRWERRQCGFYGRGIVEQLRTNQRTLNYIDKRIRDMMHYLSRGKLVVWDNGNSKVNMEHMTNAPWDIIRVHGSGNPPTVISQNSVPTEWWKWRQETIQNGYAEIGINEMQSAGQKPPGIDSGVALREVQDAGAKRFRPKVQSWERFHVDVAKLVIRELKDMADRGENPIMHSKIRRGPLTLLQTIDWKKNALEDDEYRLEVTPASSLPDTTAGRKQAVEDWYRAGFINAQEARALLQFPDLERFNSLDLASYEIILDAIETIIEDGEYKFPEPTDDLQLALKLSTQSYNKFRLRKAPEDRLELLRRYMNDVKALLERAQQEQTAIEQQSSQAIGAVSGLQNALPGGANPQQVANILKATG